MKALSGLTDVASHDFAGFGEGGGDCGLWHHARRGAVEAG
jgi:hypothetical protein